MILTYSKDEFVWLIHSGIKIHTIRQDNCNRWRKGLSIQHWRGNPRNKSKNPYKFADGECKGIEQIVIERNDRQRHGMFITIEGVRIHPRIFDFIAMNDGLTVYEFRRWFLPPGADRFEGKIIHFTDFTYTKL